MSRGSVEATGMEGNMTEYESAGGSDTLTAKVLKLVDLVGYQDGAVVSREVMKGVTGTVSASRSTGAKDSASTPRPSTPW